MFESLLSEIIPVRLKEQEIRSDDAVDKAGRLSPIHGVDVRASFNSARDHLTPASLEFVVPRFLRRLMIASCWLPLLCMSTMGAAYGAPLRRTPFNHACWISHNGAPLQADSVSRARDGVLQNGSDSGLYRLDGIHFTPFRSLPGEPQFPAISIHALYTAPDGTPWVGIFMPGIVSIRNGNEAVYTRLRPRPNTFEVENSLGNGIWSESDVQILSWVLPAWWRTGWFLMLCGAGCVCAAIILYRLRLHRFTQQLDSRCQERLDERIRIAQELHDTLLQSFQGLILRFQAVNDILLSDPVRAKEDLEKALNRADQALNDGRQAIQGIRNQTFKVQDVAQFFNALMTDLSEEFFRKGKPRPIIAVVIEGEPQTVDPPACEEIFKIAREALRNAFAHSQAQRIESEIAYSKTWLRFRFRDDGIGIDPFILEKGGQSQRWGLIGMKERARKIRAQLNVWSKPGNGTEVELIIPATIAFEPGPVRRVFSGMRKKVHQQYGDHL